jgi:hypothetical protein
MIPLSPEWPNMSLAEVEARLTGKWKAVHVINCGCSGQRRY